MFSLNWCSIGGEHLACRGFRSESDAKTVAPNDVMWRKGTFGAVRTLAFVSVQKSAVGVCVVHITSKYNTYLD